MREFSPQVFRRFLWIFGGLLVIVFGTEYALAYRPDLTRSTTLALFLALVVMYLTRRGQKTP